MQVFKLYNVNIRYKEMRDMPDWKEMYLTLMRSTEQAVRVLTEAQQKCEELYIEAEEPALVLLPGGAEPKRVEDRGNANNS